MSTQPTSSSTTTAPASDPRRWSGLAVLSASLLVVVMDMTILNIALPDITAELQPTSVQTLWIVDVYALVLAGLLVPMAALGDRFGRRRLLLIGFVIFGAASAAVLVVQTPGQVIALRALLGVGGAMIMPSTLSLIRGLFADPVERATALGIWGATAAVGGALGPVIGGLLLEHWSWHAAFLVNVPVMVIALVAGLLLLGESRSQRPPRIDALGTVLAIGGMSGAVYAVKQIGKHGPEPVYLAAAAVAVGALVIFVRRCLRVEQPMLEVRLFRRPAFSAGILTATATSIAMVALLLLGAQWLQLVEGYTPLQAGLALLPLAVGGLIGSPLAPKVAGVIGARRVLAGGLAVGGTGLLLIFALPRLLGLELGYPVVAAALTLVGIGMASLAVASAVIMASAPNDQAGSAAALEETGYELGGVLGVTLLGSLASALYRSALPADGLAGLGAQGSDAVAARESLAGALTVADGLGEAGAGLAARAADAFSDSFMWFGLAGGLLMLAASAVVWVLTPADLDLADAAH